MGAAISAPLSALGTCVGGCCGSFLAVGCCKLAGSGQVSSAKASQCMLLWLQAFAATLAVLLSATSKYWLPWTCGKLDYVSAGDVGVCHCRASPDGSCWSDQLIYRSEAVTALLFAGLLALVCSGCAQGAARSHSVAKFMAVLLLLAVSLFVPNCVFDGFGHLATGASAVFLVVQGVLFIDFGYSWNELWYSNALAARRRDIGQRACSLWIAGILAASGLLFLGALGGSIFLYELVPNTTGRTINITALVISFLLLFLSITDWCEHGNMLTSAVVMGYSLWLVCEALEVLPGGQGPRMPSWLGLSLCGLSLAVAVAHSATGEAREAPGLAAAEAGTAGTAAEEAQPVAEEAKPMTAAEAKQFAVQCLVHCLAALYVAASMAPRPSSVTFGLRSSAVFISLALYGWSLAAPKVLTNRTFS